MQRDFSIDIIKIIACLMVILMHAPFPTDNAIGFIYTGVSFFTSPCIGLFIMASGALLLPSKLPLFDFIKRRLNRILCPALFWTLFYLVLNFSLKGENNSIIKQLLSIPFSPQGHGVLWFLYTIIGLYIMTPIISPWLKTANNLEIKFILCIWFISLLLPTLSKILFVNRDVTNIFYYFSGYIGYYLAGYYIKHRTIQFKNRYLLLIFIISVFSPIIAFLFGSEKFDYDIFWYLGPFCAIMAMCIFKWICQDNYNKLNIYIDKHPVIKSSIISISKSSLGIYLVHIAIMRYFLWNQNWYINMHNCILQIIIGFVFTFVLSWGIVVLINKLPKSRYIIG